MSKVLTFGIAAVVLVCGGAFAAAQDSTPKGPGAGISQGKDGKRGERMGALQSAMKELNLTRDQKLKIKEIAKNTREAVTKLKEEKGDGKDKRAKMLEIRKKQREEIMAILTPEQKEKFQKLLDENQRKHKPGDKPGKS
jgi:Spy/CpxP family protein refolding chaperone